MAFITSEGSLQLDQGDDHVVLIRREVRQFFEKFASWAGFELTEL